MMSRVSKLLSNLLLYRTLTYLGKLLIRNFVGFIAFLQMALWFLIGYKSQLFLFYGLSTCRINKCHVLIFFFLQE